MLFSSVLGVGMDCEGGLGFVEKRELKKSLSKHKSISFIQLESSR
jgi:hypothetical protein